MNCVNIFQRSVLLGGLSTLTMGFALVAEVHTFSGLDVLVPDGNSSGVAETRLVSSPLTSLSSLSVSLSFTGADLDGMASGDLFVSLVHDTGFSVLLNRIGRTAMEPGGYLGTGLDVTLADMAPNGDVHGHGQASLVGGILTGQWAPDGRITDPASVLDTDVRTALLGSFQGVNPNGEWTLFLADLESGGVAKLTGWELEFTGASSPVPEASTWAALGVVALAGLWQVRQHGRKA
jgi:hypothetical protein